MNATDIPPAAPITAEAMPPPPDAEPLHALATQVLDGPDFGGEEQQVRWGWDWRSGFNWPGSDSATPETPGDWAWLDALAGAIGSVSNLLLWALLLVLVFWVWRNRHRFSGVHSPVNDVHGSATNIAALLRPDALPADIAAAAQSLWDAGQTRDALALLYRAALLRLGNEHSFAVPLSGTESECRRLVERQVGGERAQAFATLVAIWSRCAWAHQLPASLAAPLECFHRAVRPAPPASAAGQDSP